MQECPYCNEETITAKKKLSMGPRSNVICKNCGGVVGVPIFKSYIALLPLTLSVLSSLYLGISYGTMVLWMLGGIIMGLIQVKWVPVIKKGENE